VKHEGATAPGLTSRTLRAVETDVELVQSSTVDAFAFIEGLGCCRRCGPVHIG